MANWLVTVNYAEFDLEKAYEALPNIYWKNAAKGDGRGLQVNDMVYVFVTAPISKVMYQFKVIGQAENSEYPSAQKAFWTDKKYFQDYPDGYSILEKMNKVDKATLTLANLRQENLISKTAPIQGRTSDNSTNKTKEQYDVHQKLFNFIRYQFNAENEVFDFPDEANVNNQSFPEGAKKTVQVNRFERSPEARAKCIEIHGTRCKICDMSFEETYGAFARDFIHVHHITPLSEISESYQVNPETDLIPVCPNCHSMLHRNQDGIPLSVSRLKMFYELSNQQK